MAAWVGAFSSPIIFADFKGVPETRPFSIASRIADSDVPSKESRPLARITSMRLSMNGSSIHTMRYRFSCSWWTALRFDTYSMTRYTVLEPERRKVAKALTFVPTSSTTVRLSTSPRRQSSTPSSVQLAPSGAW